MGESTAESPERAASQRDRTRLLHGLFFFVYLSLFIVLLHLMNSLGNAPEMHTSGLDFLILCLATFRLTQIVTQEKVGQFIRAPFVTSEIVPGPGGALTEGEKPSGSGIRRVIGELLLCPWCSGVWIATLLVFFHVLVPRVAHIFTLVFATAAGAILFGILTKMMIRIRSGPSEP